MRCGTCAARESRVLYHKPEPLNSVESRRSLGLPLGALRQNRAIASNLRSSARAARLGCLPSNQDGPEITVPEAKEHLRRGRYLFGGS